MNLKNCKANMATTDKDLLTIRGFKTTTEVCSTEVLAVHAISQRKCADTLHYKVPESIFEHACRSISPGYTTTT